MELAKRGDAGILTARAARTLRVGADCVQASIALVHSAPTGDENPVVITGSGALKGLERS